MNDLDPLAADAEGAPLRRPRRQPAQGKGESMDPAADSDSAQTPYSTDSASGEAQPRRRGPKKGQPRNRYERPLAPGEATSLNPEYIVFTGQPVDDAPGRTSRLRWTRGRRAPISDEEAANVAWRRAAARLNRVYKSPNRAERIQKGKLPPTLQQALERVPAKLPDWDGRRESLHLNVPGRLSDYLTAYADMMNCSVSQLAELWIYEQIRANVRSPKEIRAAYDRMCEETYRQEREQMNASAEDEDDED